MGAFDEVLAKVSCPACGAQHDRGFQTKLFEPDYDERPGGTFEIGGAPIRAHLSVEHFEKRAGREGWDDDWIALAPWQRGTPLVALLEDQSFYCSCAAFVAPELRFDLCADGDHADVRLIGVEAELLSREDALVGVHFSELIPPGLVPLSEHAQGSKALKDGTPEERRRILAAAYREHAFLPLVSTPRTPSPGGSDFLSAPMRCRACGDRRTRFCHTSLFQDLEAPSYAESVAGEEIPVPIPPGSTHLYHAKRPVVLGERFGVLEASHPWFCACGAGPILPLLWFIAGRGSATIIEMEALDHLDDETLARVHFVHVEHVSPLRRGTS
ncbi:hypothetical protein [Polyangium fumosum]|uniref:Uncharacterized protein n=1 Tax=Polyangium fumosum TaxID=889272 RepID=A0A4U1IUR1_9BACT|nr:hypothetical protein [Polyangium fumosum]TKC98107.1 hypothetical protein E8A74_42510 [Polyangium fumosum]